MRIFVTGIDGYIGSLLGPLLIERGHEVVGLDTGYYREGWLYNSGATAAPACVNIDLRRVTTAHVKGFDAVVHLAELSNDPLGQHNPELTHQINHVGSVNLARTCKEAGIPRFVYTSSCSVYGLGSSEYMTEESATRPQTAYAQCKVLVERDLAALADDGFSPTVLRNATAFGASPRMRFDLVLNNLAGLAWTTHKITLTSDGTPWRPLAHVLDICEAVACAVEAPREAVHDQTFNVGDTEQNYQVKDIAEIVARVFPGCALTLGASDPDTRSYRVCFEKIRTRLPRFRCQWDAVSGATQLRRLFERIDLSRETFEWRSFTRLKQLEHLIRTRQIDDAFFWAPAVA
jgi:nucleoside-diphosphate-sugar epimerase